MDTINTTAPIIEPPLFISRNGAECLAAVLNTPVPKMLLGELWHEGELAVLFSSSYAGKSFLAVQAAEAISSGKPVTGLTTETPAQKVLYFDFESSDRQFARTYSNADFSDNFIRITINPRLTEVRKFGHRLIEAMEAAIKEHDARVIVIDSLSELKYFVNELFFLTHLLRLKLDFNLSVLLVAGAKKLQPGRPLTLNHLAAHKMLAGMAGSVFALGISQVEENGRYLIQLKGKEQGRVYNENHVIVGRNTFAYAPGYGEQGVTGNLPGFEFTGYSTERQQFFMEADGLDAEILELKQAEPWLSLGEIAKRLVTHKMKVKRVLDKYGEDVTTNREFEICESGLEILGTAPAPIHPDPFRGDIDPSGHSSERGVSKTLSCPKIGLHLKM